MLKFFYDPNGLTGVCLGKQVSDYLGAESNSKDIYSEDILIYIRTAPPEEVVDKMSDRVFIDIGDAVYMLKKQLKDYSRCSLIVRSSSVIDYLRSLGIKNKCLVIPHHHCNFENRIRERVDVNRVGYFGGIFGYDFNIALTCRLFNIVDLRFNAFYSDRPDDLTREKLSDYLVCTDITIGFRKIRTRDRIPEMGCALKIMNSASFKVPFVGYPEPSYIIRCNGAFVPVCSLEEMVKECEKLRSNPNYYQDIAEKSYEISKEYHISKTAPLYRELEKEVR